MKLGTVIHKQTKILANEEEQQCKDLGCSIHQGCFAGTNRARQQNSPLPVLVSITACCAAAGAVVLHSVIQFQSFTHKLLEFQGTWPAFYCAALFTHSLAGVVAEVHFARSLTYLSATLCRRPCVKFERDQHSSNCKSSYGDDALESRQACWFGTLKQHGL